MGSPGGRSESADDEDEQNPPSSPPSPAPDLPAGPQRPPSAAAGGAWRHLLAVPITSRDPGSAQSVTSLLPVCPASSRGDVFVLLRVGSAERGRPSPRWRPQPRCRRPPRRASGRRARQVRRRCVGQWIDRSINICDPAGGARWATSCSGGCRRVGASCRSGRITAGERPP